MESASSSGPTFLKCAYTAFRIQAQKSMPEFHLSWQNPLAGSKEPFARSLFVLPSWQTVHWLQIYAQIQRMPASPPSAVDCFGAYCFHQRELEQSSTIKGLIRLGAPLPFQKEKPTNLFKSSRNDKNEFVRSNGFRKKCKNRHWTLGNLTRSQVDRLLARKRAR